MLPFDSYGNLTPYKAIKTDLEQVEQVFVHAFKHSQTRERLFANYLAFLEELKQVLAPGFSQWLDGSFTTQKLDPNDVDIVTFVHFEEYQAKIKELDRFRQLKFGKVRDIDCYFVEVFPPGHRYFVRTQMDTMEWLDLFSHTRPLQNHRKLPKGFIQLTFEKP